jgi:hypothetical protein
MVTVGKLCNNGRRWVTMKQGGARIGVIMRDNTWRELGFSEKLSPATSRSDAIGRLLIQLNGGFCG